jgi:hypothetical protein
LFRYCQDENTGPESVIGSSKDFFYGGFFSPLSPDCNRILQEVFWILLFHAPILDMGEFSVR